MAFSAEQKREQAAEYLEKYFPGLSQNQAKLIIDAVVEQFVGDHSPKVEEQNHKKAKGLGVSLEDFTIYVATLLLQRRSGQVDQNRMTAIHRGVF